MREKKMIFEVGKFYQHNTGGKIAVICEANTTLWGENVLISEDCCGELHPVGRDESHSVNWHEITKDEWMKNFK